MAKVIMKKMSDGTLFRITGDAEMRHAIRMRDCFARLAAEDIGVYYIDLSGMGEIDISFLQLVVSFRNTLAKKGQTVVFEKLSSSRAISDCAETIGLNIQTIL
jgi:ABC-type transporter Mla MlaB component